MKVMTDTVTRPGIDPHLKALFEAVPMKFTNFDGVQVVREMFRAVRPPAAMPAATQGTNRGPAALGAALHPPR